MSGVSAGSGIGWWAEVASRASRFCGNDAWLAPELGGDEAPFDYVESLEGEVFRAMPDRTTLRFERCGKGYFLKFHRGVGWSEILKNLMFFRLPILGAENEKAAIQLLADRGVDTMTAAGFGSVGCSPASRRSFLITEEIAGAPSLEEVTADWGENSPPSEVKIRLVRVVAGIVKEMHDAGVNHRDLYLCHFLLRGGDLEVPRPALIDLHRAQIRRRVPRRWRRKDLAALYSSAAHISLSDRDLLRFLRVYFDRPLRDVFRGDSRELDRIRKAGDKLRKKYLRKYHKSA